MGLRQQFVTEMLRHSIIPKTKGKTWITLQEPSAGIGGGTVFGNEAPWNWLGGFGVNLRDPNWVYGCTMSSAISSDGGKNFDQFAWSIRLTSLQEDGKYYAVTILVIMRTIISFFLTRVVGCSEVRMAVC